MLKYSKKTLIFFFLKYKHAVPLIIYAIIYMTWFAWLEKNITGHYRIIHMAADDYIPFCEVFVIPYFLWFAVFHRGKDNKSARM